MCFPFPQDVRLQGQGSKTEWVPLRRRLHQPYQRRIFGPARWQSHQAGNQHVPLHDAPAHTMNMQMQIMERPSHAFSFHLQGSVRSIQWRRTRQGNLLSRQWPTSADSLTRFKIRFRVLRSTSVSYCRRTTVQTFWPRRSWTCWPDWWGAWRLKTQPKMKVAFGSTCFPPTKRRRRRRQ